MASKQVKDELKLGYTLVSGGRALADELAQRRAAQYEARGIAKRDVESAIRAGTLAELRSLEFCGEALLVADDTLDVTEARSPATITRRDAATEACLRSLVATREVITSVCDESAERNLGFSGSILRDPESVEKLAGRVVSRLETDPPTVVRIGVTLDIAALVKALRRDHAELVAANEVVRTTKHEINLARARRDEAWTLYTTERTQVGARLDAALRVVGLGDAADGLFPTRVKTAQEPNAPVEPKREEPAAGDPRQPQSADAQTAKGSRKTKRAEKADAKPKADGQDKPAPADGAPAPADAQRPPAQPADPQKLPVAPVIPAVNTRPSMPAPPS